MYLFNEHTKKGFTLAEVLITLAIVGTVAAMTIPTLMMNYQKNIWEAKLKKTYGIATNACERMLVEENISHVNESAVYSALGASTKSADSIDTALRKYFKLMKKTDTDGKMLLPDGAEVVIANKNNGFSFDVDVNSAKTRPNIVGKDIFAFDLDKDCSYVIPTSAAADKYKDFDKTANNDWKIPDSYSTPSAN